MRLLSATISATFFCSCAKLPELNGPKAVKSLPLPAAYGKAQSQGIEIKSGLLSIFTNDRTLRSHILNALHHNPNLQVSAATLEEAGYDLDAAHAGLFPTVGFNSSAEQTRSTFRGNTAEVANYRIGLDVNWEVDVWGRLKSIKNATGYNVKAIEADYNFARQSLVAQTAQAYFTLLSTSELLHLTERNYNSLLKTYQTTERHFERGTSSLASSELAKTDLENMKASVESAKDAHERASRQLSVLTGQAPTHLAHASGFPSIGKPVKAGIPSELLINRPDLYAAYLRVLASDEQIKIAHRNLFPSFSLTGNLGQQSNILSDLLKGDFTAWSIGGAITAPIFDAGILKAELGASSARSKVALAQYKSTVLTALEEVENALSAEYYLKTQIIARQSALKSAKTLLEAQQRTFITEEALINTTLQRYQNRVTLALALGKGI